MNRANIVYVVDPDKATGDALTTLLKQYGIEVRSFDDSESFLKTYRSASVGDGCLLLDADLPEANSLELLKQLREQSFRLPIIVLENTSDRAIHQEALQLGATDVLEKSLINAYLIERLSELLPGTTHRLAGEGNQIEFDDGQKVIFRSMRPEDAEIEQAFVRALSAKSKYLRFFSGIKQLSPHLLEQLVHTNFPDSFAVIATVSDAGQERQIGVARYSPTEEAGVAEFAIVVADEWQGRGLASHLFHMLITAAVVAGVHVLVGFVLRENQRMLKLAGEMGFIPEKHKGDSSIVRVVKVLNESTV